MESLTYDILSEAVGGASPGIRLRVGLEPLGGPGDKVFPPTYLADDNKLSGYAEEKRRIGGEDRDCVVLDSVASQANRMELALLNAFRRDELIFPIASVDFRDVDELQSLDRISSLEAPHRIFDAILRDSLNGDMLFRHSPAGRAITEATPHNSAAMFHYSPTTLLYGGWDSTGPKGGRGAKYERAITSEIVAIGISPGVKTSSRIDPLAIEKGAGPIYKAADKDGGWTLDATQARTDKAGAPSDINHGNYPPTIDSRTGGITADEIRATTVLSFAALRKLRFPVDSTGSTMSAERRADAERSARAAIAALGLAGLVLTLEQGQDLRSRCALVANEIPRFELLNRLGEKSQSFTLSTSEAIALVNQASEEATSYGLSWYEGELLLTPTDSLSELIRRSRKLSGTSEEGE